MYEKTKTIALILLVTLVLFSALPAGLAGAETTDAGSFIKVTGQAEIKVKPDVAYINLGVETRDETAQGASQENARLTDALIKALKDFGIKDDQMKTGSFYIYMDREIIEPYRDQDKYLTYYRAVNELTLTTSDLDQVGTLIDIAVNNGANRVNSLYFDVKDAELVKLQALQKAALQSRSKGQAVAQALGLQITGIKSVTEESSYYTPFRADYARMGMGGPEMVPDTQILPGDVTIYAQIVTEFSF